MRNFPNLVEVEQLYSLIKENITYSVIDQKDLTLFNKKCKKKSGIVVLMYSGILLCLFTFSAND